MSEYVTLDLHNEYARRIEDENDRQNKRLSNLEDTVKQIQSLTISVNGMALSIERMVKQLERQGERLDAIEKEPADKWKKAVSLVVTMLITAVVTYALTKVGL